MGLCGGAKCDRGRLLGYFFTVLWWSQSLLELVGAILLFSETNFIDLVRDHWAIYSTHLQFMGYSLVGLLGWKSLTSGVVLYGSRWTFRFLVGIYVLFMTSWFGPLLASAVNNLNNYWMFAWAVMVIGAVSYLVRFKAVFKTLDKIYPEIYPFFAEYRNRILVRVTVALSLLTLMWATWAMAFTWYCLFRFPNLSTTQTTVFLIWLSWSMYWRSTVVLAGLTRTFSEDFWAWMQGKPPPTCTYSCLGPLVIRWPALATSSWIMAYQSIWQMFQVAIPIPLPDNPDKPAFAKGMAALSKDPTEVPANWAANCIRQQAPRAPPPPGAYRQKASAQADVKEEEEVEDDNEDVWTWYCCGVTWPEPKHRPTLAKTDWQSEAVPPPPSEPTQQDLEMLAAARVAGFVEAMETSPIKAALLPSVNNPPSQFVHTLLHLESTQNWYSAYKASVALFKLNPKLAYFAHAHPISFGVVWFGIAGAATVVALYQLYFPNSQNDPEIDQLLITMLQVFQYFAGYIIVTCFIIVFGACSYVVLYGMTNEKVDLWKDVRPQLFETAKSSINTYWFNNSFA